MAHKEGHVTINTEELRDIVREEFDNALTKLGIDAQCPFEMQKDFQFTREMRVTAESIKSKSILTLAGVVTVGIVGAVWAGVETVLRRGGTLPPH